MKAVKVIHMSSNKQIAVSDHPEPKLTGPTDVLVRILCVGLDGTDKEIVTTSYGWAPPNQDELIFGHESLGVVADVGEQAGLGKGDLVAMVVRRPCHDPACVNCRNGRADYCQTGKYTERGIKGENGCLTEYIVDDERYFVRVPPECRAFGMLAEPQSIIEKVWDEVQYIQQRLIWEPKQALVLGSGPLGLLAALTARCLGLDVHVWSMDPQEGPGGQIIRQIGGVYQQAPGPAQPNAMANQTATNPAQANPATANPAQAHPQQPASLTEYAKTLNAPFDLIFECTGFAPLGFEAMDVLGPNGVLAMLGLSSGKKDADIPVDRLNMEMVLHNKLVVGSVNAAKKHFETGLYRLQEMNNRYPGILGQIITERIALDDVPRIDFKKVAIKAVVDIVPPDRWEEATKNSSEAVYSFSV